ncbi:MAG TPA: co-chaperone GroES [Bdellovibrio sp.]
MAKKKSSAKQTKKAKAAPKKKTVTKKATPKKAVKKTVAKKAAVKKAAKPVAAKKAVAKTSAKKSSAKASPKKAMKAPATKKSAPVKAATPAKQHLLKSSEPTKVLDLSDFVTPLDDRLIIQLSGAEKMTAGGLYIPDTVADTSGNLQGVVVSVGRGHVSKKGHLRPMDVQLGDKVVFSEYAGSKIKIQNEDLIIIREGDVMGVVAK